MNIIRPCLPALLSLPLAAQAWDVRLETPFPKGQDLPAAQMQSSGQTASGHLDTGHVFEHGGLDG